MAEAELPDAAGPEVMEAVVEGSAALAAVMIAPFDMTTVPSVPIRVSMPFEPEMIVPEGPASVMPLGPDMMVPDSPARVTPFVPETIVPEGPVMVVGSAAARLKAKAAKRRDLDIIFACIDIVVEEVRVLRIVVV